MFVEKQNEKFSSSIGATCVVDFVLIEHF